jgi:hypothetical protein
MLPQWLAGEAALGDRAILVLTDERRVEEAFALLPSGASRIHSAADLEPFGPDDAVVIVFQALPRWGCEALDAARSIGLPIVWSYLDSCQK